MATAAPRFTANPSKALEVILWLASERPGIDVYHLSKAAYYADKHHVAHYGRPIVGDDYEAAQFGPLPQVIWGILRGRPIEMLALNLNGPPPFSVDPNRHTIEAGRAPNIRVLSESDREALRQGLEHVADKTFDALVDETHEDPAYVKAAGGRIDYRDFIPRSDPHWEEKVEALSEDAPYAVF